MPCIKQPGGGYKIKEYPKVYPTLEACKKRVAQMEYFDKTSDTDKKKAYENAKSNI